MQISVLISLYSYSFSCPVLVHPSSIVQYNIVENEPHRKIAIYSAILHFRGCQIRQVFKNGEFTIGSIQKWRIYNASTTFSPENDDDRTPYRLPTVVASPKYPKKDLIITQDASIAA